MRVTQVLYTAFMVFGIMVVIRVFWPLIIVIIAAGGFMLWNANRKLKNNGSDFEKIQEQPDVIDVAYEVHEVKEDEE